MLFTKLEDVDGWTLPGTALDTIIMLPHGNVTATITFQVTMVPSATLQIVYDGEDGSWDCKEWDITRNDERILENLNIVTRFHVDSLVGPSLYIERTSIPGRDIRLVAHYYFNEGQTPSDGCPKCGHDGEWVRTALVCPTHGFFAGF